MSSVSVVVPSYNYAHYLEGCVQSVVSQPGVEVEVLIIDDCSQDDTPAVATRLAENDSRITFRRHAQNRGHIATYNEGLQWASGDYTVVLSADDLLTDGALSRAVTVMDDQPDVGLVYGRSLYFVSNDELPIARSGVPWSTDGTVPIGSRSVARRRPAASRRLRWWSARACRRRSVATASTCRTPADVEMWLRFAANGDVAYLGHVDQAFYRKHPGEHDAHDVRGSADRPPAAQGRVRRGVRFLPGSDPQRRRRRVPLPIARWPARHCGERAARSITGSWSRYVSTTSKRSRSRRTQLQASSARTSAFAGGAASEGSVVSSSSRSS